MKENNAFSKYQKERNKPAPSLLHSFVQSNLVMPLYSYRHRFRISMELKLNLPPDDWFTVPDFAILPKMKINFQNDILAYTTVPLGIIEIITENQPLSDLTNRKNRYFTHGVKSCWIVIPEFKNIYVFSSTDDYDIFKETDTLKDKNLDISFSLKEVFQ